MSGHDLIFDKIMMMVGLSSLKNLHRCRQVCTAWNTMIMQNIWENPIKRNIIKMRIEEQRAWLKFKVPEDAGPEQRGQQEMQEEEEGKGRQIVKIGT